MKHLHRFLAIFLLFYFISLPANASEILSRQLDSLRGLLTTNVLEADSFAYRLHAEIQQNQLTELLGKSFYYLGVIEYYKGNYLLSAKYYEEALENIDPQVFPTMRADILNNLGVDYEFMERYPEAIDAYLKSLEYALSKGDSVSIHQSYINLGLLFTKVKDFDQATRYLDEAYAYFYSQQDTFNTVLTLQNQALLYRATNQTDAAIDKFRTAIQLISALNAPLELANLYNDYMYFLLLSKRVNTFEADLQRFLGIIESTESELIRASSLGTLAHYEQYFNQNYRRAADYLIDAIELFTAFEATQKLEDFYPQLLNCLNQLKETALLEIWLQRYRDFLKKKYAIETEERIAALRAIQSIQEMEAKEQMLEQTIEQKNKRITLWLVIALLFVGSTLVIGYFYLMVRRNERSLVKRGLELTDSLDESDEEEEILLSENTSELNAEEPRAAQLRPLFGAIRKFVVKDKNYLNPGLKLSDIAYALGTNDKYISQAVWLVGKKRFNAYVNFYRINEAKKILRRTDAARMGMKVVASKSGFTTQSSFQRKFKELTGVTPQTFQKLANQNLLDSEEE